MIQIFVRRDDHSDTKLGFMILNRLNSDNTQEVISPGMEFRLQPPFILYGKGSGKCKVAILCLGGVVYF